jgi:hypothetical protein
LSTGNPKPQIHNGSLVKIITAHKDYPIEDVGAVGKVITINDIDETVRHDNEMFYVEFLFRNPKFLNQPDCDCYWFPASAVELAPEGSARTRVSRAPVIDDRQTVRINIGDVEARAIPTRPFSTTEPTTPVNPISGYTFAVETSGVRLYPITDGTLINRDNAPNDVRDNKFSSTHYEEETCTRCGQRWSAH